jgi:hypothetical protein
VDTAKKGKSQRKNKGCRKAKSPQKGNDLKLLDDLPPNNNTKEIGIAQNLARSNRLR